MVSSASIDVMTTASPYTEERRQGSLGMDVLQGKTQYSVSYTLSDESDYTANTASFDVSQDIFGDLTTVSFGFSQGWDEVRKRDDNAFNETVDRRSYRFGKVFLNAACACGSDFGCGGRTDSRRNPSAAVRRADLADRPLMQGYAELCLDAVLEVAASPAHKAVAVRVGTGLDPRRKRGQVFGQPPPGPVRHRPVHQPGQPLGIGAVHPVPKRLAVHPAGPHRRRPVHPLQNQRDRQHAPRRPRILRPDRRRT
jgi:hypothetical protein